MLTKLGWLNARFVLMDISVLRMEEPPMVRTPDATGTRASCLLGLTATLRLI